MADRAAKEQAVQEKAIQRKDTQDKTILDRLIREQRQKEKSNAPQRQGGISKRREEILVAQIQESFQVLRFMERVSMYSRSQIDAFFASKRLEYNEYMKAMDDLDLNVKLLDEILKVPEEAEIVQARIERMSGNRDYVKYELAADKKQLSEYRDMIRKNNLNDPESFKIFTEQMIAAREKMEQFRPMLEDYKKRLAEYDRYIAVLDRIDKENGRGTGAIGINISQNLTCQDHSTPPEKKQRKRSAYER